MLACAAVLGAMALFLHRLGPARGEREFLTAAGRLPAWAVALHFVAAEASAMTVLGVPAAAFRDDWRYMQFFAGSAAARVVLALWLLPAMRAGGDLTAYGWLERRFGPGARRWSAAAFVAARLVVSALRLAAAAAALSVVAGAPPAAWLGVLAAFSAGAVLWGGLRGAVFLGAAQTVLLVAGGAVLALYAAFAHDGGPVESLRAADTARKLAVWRPWEAPAAVLGGFVGSLAAFAADAEMMQGALHANGDAGRRGLLGSVFGALGLLAVYLGLGTALWAYYDHNTALALPDTAGSILPHFAAQNMGRWGSQLVAALLVLAVVDLPLVGLGAAAVGDLGWRRPVRTVVLAGAALIALAAAVSFGRPAFSDFAARLGAAAYGPVLGLVLYGVFGPRRAARSAVPALAAATLFALLLMALEAAGRAPFGWHWAPVLAAAAAAGLAHFLSEGGHDGGHHRRA